jgi:hypothetical protein
LACCRPLLIRIGAGVTTLSVVSARQPEVDDFTQIKLVGRLGLEAIKNKGNHGVLGHCYPLVPLPVPQLTSSYCPYIWMVPFGSGTRTRSHASLALPIPRLYQEHFGHTQFGLDTIRAHSPKTREGPPILRDPPTVWPSPTTSVPPSRREAIVRRPRLGEILPSICAPRASKRGFEQNLGRSLFLGPGNLAMPRFFVGANADPKPKFAGKTGDEQSCAPVSSWLPVTRHLQDYGGND